jgi:hypothetical protein
MVFSRSVPQQMGQISPPTPGQYRRACLFSHNLQGVLTGRYLYRIIGKCRGRTFISRWSWIWTRKKSLAE